MPNNIHITDSSCEELQYAQVEVFDNEYKNTQRNNKVNQ